MWQTIRHVLCTRFFCMVEFFRVKLIDFISCVNCNGCNCCDRVCVDVVVSFFLHHLARALVVASNNFHPFFSVVVQCAERKPCKFIIKIDTKKQPIRNQLCYCGVITVLNLLLFNNVFQGNAKRKKTIDNLPILSFLRITISVLYRLFFLLSLNWSHLFVQMIENARKWVKV